MRKRTRVTQDFKMLCRSAPSVANDQSGGNRGHCNDLQRPPDCQTNHPTIYKCYSSFSVKRFTFPTCFCWCFSHTLQATPQLTDRAKVLDILDPCLQETANVKHLHQVRKQKDHRPDRSLDSFYRSDWKLSISPKHLVIVYHVWVTSSTLDVKKITLFPWAVSQHRIGSLSVLNSWACSNVKFQAPFESSSLCLHRIR